MLLTSQPLFFCNNLPISMHKTAGKMVTQLVAHPLLAPCHSDAKLLKIMAEPTGLEPATSDVTGRRSNQLNYDSAKTCCNRAGDCAANACRVRRLW